MTEYALSSKVNTSAEHHITPSDESELDFDEKNQIYWNGTLRNTHIKFSEGFPTTSGQTVKIKPYKANKDGEEEQGVSLVTDKAELHFPYKAVLAAHYKTKPKAAGKQIAHTYYNGRILTLYKDSQQNYTLIETDLEDNLVKSKVVDASTAMISSVYKLDEQPIIFINNKLKFSATEYENTVKVFGVFDYFDFDEKQPKYEYILSETLYNQLLSLEQEKGDQQEIVATLLQKYLNILSLYNNSPSEEGKQDVNEAYGAYLLAYNKLQELERKYLETLWEYDYREEVNWCLKEIEANEYVRDTLQEELDKLNKDNSADISRRETLENNIRNLTEHLEQDEERLYSMKAPALSEEATQLKNQLEAKLMAAQKELNKVQAEYTKHIKNYRDTLDNYKEAISWSWAISSTASRSGTYTFDGHRANLLLPANNLTFGNAVAKGQTLYLNANLCGTMSGYGDYAEPQIRFSIQTSATNKITWTNSSSKIYLSAYKDKFYGFNWKQISAYKDVVEWNAKYEAQLDAYNAANDDYNKGLLSNIELAGYYRFVQSYNSLQDHIDAERIQRDRLIDTLNELLAKNISYQEQKDYLEGSIEKISDKLEDLRKQLKRARLNVENMEKREVLDEEGNIVYQDLEPIFKHETKDGVPLGDAHSATMFRDSDGYKHIVIAFDDDDKNRALTLHYDEKQGSYKEYKWFGCVGLNGTITGEPIPDPDVFTDWQRRSNGTYQIAMRDAKNAYLKGSLIGGYEWSSNKYNKIEIENWTNNESVRVNMSANDTLTEDEKKDKKPDPKEYFVSNFADSRGLYYDYGPGWLKCYVRKIYLNSNKIKDCYIYTYGSVNENTLPYRKESVMAKGKTKEWDFEAGKLNKRIYTVGTTNKADDSLLSILPFSVQVVPDERTSTGTVPGLRMQMFGLMPLSFSFRTSLVSNGEEHTDQFQVQVSADENTIILSTLSMVYVIKKTSEPEYFKIWKTADYYFQTNILDDDNVLIEDRNENLSIERGSIPYCEECVLDIEDKNLDIPEAKELVSNNTWYWAAAYNPFFLNTTNSSYILPAISLPLYVKSEQLEQFQEETLEQRGSLLRPMLKGLFNEYEGVDIFYTIATVTTTLYYKTTHIVKTSDINEDNYDIYGKETYNVDMANTTYAVATNTQFFPIAVGSVVEGINYITPTIELENEYAVRLYNNANKVYGGYQYAARIYNGTNVFTIYGRNYYYDKQGIYFIGTSDQYTSNQFVCYTLGMKYLASSGSEAYFYSAYDKQIYIFTGSNTLQRMEYLSNQGDIQDSLFSSHEQMLYLLMKDNDEYKVVMISEKDSAVFEIPEGVTLTKPHLEGCELGCAIVDKENFIIFSPYRELDDIMPFKLRTGYFGSNSTLVKLSHFDVLLFKLNDKPIKVKLTTNTINGIEVETEEKEITINNNMWKGQSYRLRYSPRNNIGNSFQVGIESDDYMAMSYLGFEASPVATQIGAARQVGSGS